MGFSHKWHLLLGKSKGSSFRAEAPSAEQDGEVFATDDADHPILQTRLIEFNA
mgnify:CR=1 FL=1